MRLNSSENMKRKSTRQAGPHPPTYRYFHRLHGEVTGWLQSLRSRGVPESGERSEGSEAHECVGWKRTYVLPDVNQLWHPKIPEQFMDFHGSVLVIPQAEFC